MKGLGISERNGFYYLSKRVDGRRVRVSLGIEVGKGKRAKELKAAAERRAAEILGAAYEGDHGWTAAPRFADWWNDYINGPGLQNAKAGESNAAETIERKQRTGKLLVKHFGHILIDRITPMDCMTFMSARMQAGQKPSSVRTESQVCAAALRAAVMARKLKVNPWHGLMLPKITPKRRVLSQDEQARIFETLENEIAGTVTYATRDGRQVKQDPAEVRTIKNFITVVIGTGLRIGAVCKRLKPANVQGEVIEVQSKGKLQRVPLLPIVKEALDAQTSGDRFFFPMGKGAMQKSLRRLAKRAGIAPFTPHDLRRTFGTRLALGEGGSQPVPLSVLSELMGHSNIVTTATFYTVAGSDEAKRKALARSSGALSLGQPDTKQATA